MRGCERRKQPRMHGWPDNWSECARGERGVQVPSSPLLGGVKKNRCERSVAVCEVGSEFAPAGVTLWAGGSGRAIRSDLGVLGNNSSAAENAFERAGSFPLDGRDRPEDLPATSGVRHVRPKRKWRESQVLRLGPELIHPVPGLPPAPGPPTARPVEPPEVSQASSHHLPKATQSGPVAALADESFFDTVGQDVADASKKSLVVEDWLCGVAAFPERASPADQPPDLPRDVGQQELHESRQVPLRCPNQEMEVIGSENEREEFDSGQSRRPGQYTAQDLVRLARRTEEQAPLEAPRRHKVDPSRLVHPQRPGHGLPPCL